MKRFTDTDLWKKTWFFDLTPAEKLAWFFIKDQCDNVGVWDPNIRLAETIIGTQLDWEKFMAKTHDNLILLDNGKWFIPDFCGFQYGELNENCRPHQSYLLLLRKHGLIGFKGYPKGIHTLKDKDKEKDKEKEQEKDKDKEQKNFKKPTVNEVSEYCKERGNSIDPVAFISHYESNGWMVGKVKMKDWKAAIVTWERKDKTPRTKPIKEEPDVFANASFFGR